MYDPNALLSLASSSPCAENSLWNRQHPLWRVCQHWDGMIADSEAHPGDDWQPMGLLRSSGDWAYWMRRFL